MGYSGALLKRGKKILFQLRDEKGRNPNKWGIFGGGIKENETPREALVREIEEELNISISKLDISKEHIVPFINYHIYEIKLKKAPTKSNLQEGKDMKFMTKKEFLKTKNALFRVKFFLWILNIN